MTLISSNMGKFMSFRMRPAIRLFLCLGEQLEIEINELIYALDNQLPGKVQELRNQKDRSEQW